VLTLMPVSSVGAHPWTSSVVPTPASASTLRLPSDLKLPKVLGRASAANAARLAAKLLRGLNPLVGAASTLKFPRLKIPRGPSGQLRPVAGSAVGLYGGTELLSVCDKRQLVSFLEANPAKAAAWAAVQGIKPAQIPAYIAELTDVVLPVDTRVTNHGFLNGAANPIDEVLQAGTAVLIDSFGVPRARCYCGNPLTPPRPLASKPTITGARWPGFTLSRTVVIEPVRVVKTFTTTDVLTGTTAVVRPRGAGPSQATILQSPGASPPPVTTQTSSSTTTTTTATSSGAQTTTSSSSTSTASTSSSAATTTTPTSSAPPDLTGSWISPQSPSSPPWVLVQSTDLQTLTGTWRGSDGHSGLRGSFTAMLLPKGGYAGSAHVTEGAVAVNATITISTVSANAIEISIAQSNQTNTQTFELERSGPSAGATSAGGTATGSAGSVSWTGDWNTSFGATHLTQSGNQVTGTYAYCDGRATINGQVSGNALDGTWVQPCNSRNGHIHFVLSRDGSSFAGTWGYGNASPTSSWNGTRAKSKTRAATASCHLQGDWEQTTAGQSSIWHISSDGQATEAGLGSAHGTAALVGHVLTINSFPSDPTFDGIYKWTLDPECRGTGTLTFTHAPHTGQSLQSTVIGPPPTVAAG
jgi:hypothetical protein